MPDKVLLRHSLLVRLLSTSVLIALCSIAATAWLAVHLTTRALEQEQGQVLADDAAIQDALTAYAATHGDWSRVEPTLRRLSHRTGQRIALTTESHQVLADTTAKAASLPRRSSAAIDPLRAESVSGAGRVEGYRIDPRAVGPYRLPARERSALFEAASTMSACLQRYAIDARVVESPSGRPRLEPAAEDNRPLDMADCDYGKLSSPTPVEQRALRALDKLVKRCLAEHQPEVTQEVRVLPDFTWAAKAITGPRAKRAVQKCVDDSRRRQLDPYVAAPALLYLASEDGSTDVHFELSRQNTGRLVGMTGAILALTVAVTTGVAIRLVRPLRALTEAARHSGEDHLMVPVTTRDETGTLAAAFNALSERRSRLEAQRKAMVSDIAHELRTPLTTMRAWLEVAHDGIVTPDPAFLRSLLEEAVLLQRIVDDLQILAAADAGELPIHPEPLRLNHVLSQVAAAHQAQATASGVELSVQAASDVELTADPTRLRQAVGNLVANAVQHTPPGGVVALSAHRTANSVTIQVADTGTGIAPGDLAQIFERFWRSEKSRSRRTGGSGLGLAIVRQLVEAHGGTVTAESVPGLRTVFTVDLPVREHPCA
ncbi:cell wall metabolism sensor histidine kinase WalK [Streptomyces sp. NBC_00568]|uniref:sensor histidine kinase n=1 Tax=Streptomyces sp. NBC_00568 TaxID=2975779 RepID=UPI00225BF0C4|nr:HAMP domain-containing sensor histidine kinase [Streptomyces sp. NBC_00568]MCX4993626.1 HAMP domain-containing histidine kinase [Streptomyces sp. NBC_00568]